MVDTGAPNPEIPRRVKAPLGKTSDYSPIASRYDATRDMPERYLLACYDRLIERGLFPRHGRVLDAGCGTGQVSLPLAARGYEVRGIDISAEMVRLAQAKVRPEWRARYVQGDVRDIPDIDGSVDAVVVSKLLQHVQDWQEACRQLIRVVRPACPVVHINERGAFGNAVRRYFAKRADELGFTGRYFGLNPHSGLQLATFMESQGCRTIPVDAADLRWETAISYGEAISRIQERLFAEFWYLPAEIHDRIVTDTITWIEAQPDGGNTVEHLKPYLIVTAFRTPDHDPA